MIDTPEQAPTALIDAGKLKAIYTAMLQYRGAGRSSSKRNPAIPNAEAVLAGVLPQLRAGDGVGGLPPAMLDTVLPGNSPFTMPAGRDPASGLQIANGMALAAKVAQRGDIAAVFYHDAGQDADAALAYAGAQMLPVLYIAQQREDKIRKRPWRHAFPSIPVDMHDAIAVYRVAFESIKRARTGGGPTWIECRPWRVQSPSAKAAANSNRHGQDDPLAKLEKYIAARGLDPQIWRREAQGISR